jgi:MFS family permease
VLAVLKRIAVDLSPLRASRDFRLLVAGEIVTNLGTQAALVALPYQIYVTSRSATLVGLLGAFELGPMIVVSLLGGALADRVDRRRLLAAAQLGVIAASTALAVAAFSGKPPVLLVLVLGGLLAGSAALDSVIRSAIVPGVLPPGRLPSGLALNYGLYQVTGIVGPALGGLIIAASSVGVSYAIDAGTCVAMLLAALAMSPQPPRTTGPPPPVGPAIVEGLRFVRSNRALAGSFAIDLNAMTFGMPRALFAVLALSRYHAGAGGTGLLYAAISAGSALAVLSSGWVGHARRLGRIVIAMVVLWGAAVAGLGLVGSIAPAILLLALAGYADSVSAFCRSTINQTVTPDSLRGRMSAVYSLVVSGGPRLGDIESGVVAGAVTPAFSVLSGGLACIAGVGVIVLAFPQLAAFDVRRDGASLRSASSRTTQGRPGQARLEAERAEP